MPSSPPDPARARAVMRRRGRSFALASRLLPAPVRDDVRLLYLAFRSLDDLVDEGLPDAADRVAAVEGWAGGAAPRSEEARMFDHVCARHPLPRDAVADFCRGMRHDLERRPCLTEEELDRYCYRVAGTVGRVLAAVLGTRDAAAERHAAVLGMAMQRTNVLRDIDEDLAAGRTYVARETVDRHGSLAPGRREALLREQIAIADRLYDDGMRGIPALRRGRAAVAAAAGLYREILRQVERDGYGRSPGRAVVSRPRRLLVAGRHVVAAGSLRGDQGRPVGSMSGGAWAGSST